MVGCCLLIATHQRLICATWSSVRPHFINYESVMGGCQRLAVVNTNNTRIQNTRIFILISMLFRTMRHVYEDYWEGLYPPPCCFLYQFPPCLTVVAVFAVHCMPTVTMWQLHTVLSVIVTSQKAWFMAPGWQQFPDFLLLNWYLWFSNSDHVQRGRLGEYFRRGIASVSWSLPTKVMTRMILRMDIIDPRNLMMDFLTEIRNFNEVRDPNWIRRQERC